MIVPCPQCKARFQLKDPSISGSGKLIRCPACSHGFVVKSSDERDVASAAGAGIRAPAVKAVEELVIPAAKTKARRVSGGPAKAASPTPPERPVTGPSVDPAALCRLAASRDGDGAGLVARIVNTYVLTSQKLLSAIRDAVEVGDLKAFVSAAHTFKSSSAHFGALRLSSLCDDLDSLGRGGSCEGARELVDRISEEFESVKGALAAEDLSSRAPSDGIDPKGAMSPSHAEETVKAAAESEVLAHVLVAEDNEVNQLVVVAVLESMGCRVDAVEDGQQAIDLLEGSSHYDVVFMDCEMPTMDAFEATRIVRAREAEAAQAAGGAPVRRLPIVALTAHDQELDRQQCFAAGMDDYLTKPFTKADLEGAIERAKQGAFAELPAPARSQRPDPPAAASKPKKRSKSTGAGAAAPQSCASAGDPRGRAARGERAVRRMPRGPDGLPPPAQMPRPDELPPPAQMPRQAAAAPSLPPIASVPPTGQAAPQQDLASTRGADLDERPRAEPRWRQLLRDPRAVMPWAIGGGAFLLLLALVDLLWLSPPEPQLAAPSPGAAVERPAVAPWPALSKPAAPADRGASSAASAPSVAEPGVTSASLPLTAPPAAAPEVAPELVAKPQPQAKPATAAQPRTKTTPRTSVRRAAKSPTRVRTTRTPKTRSETSPSSSGRRKAVAKKTKPRSTWGGRTVKKEPKTSSQSSQKEAQDGWSIEY